MNNNFELGKPGRVVLKFPSFEASFTTRNYKPEVVNGVFNHSSGVFGTLD
jgi:hypothetical protein